MYKVKHYIVLLKSAYGQLIDSQKRMKIEYLADHPEHIPALARLHFAEWGHLNPQESLQGRINRLSSYCGRHAIPSVVIAIEDDELLGSAVLTENDMTTRPELTPWLAGVFVKPAHREKGVGSAMVTRIESEARALATPILYLQTNTAAPLYKRLGWSALEHCEYRGENVLIMNKRLLA